MKIEISKMWILWKLRFQKYEFCENWDFKNVNFVKNWDFQKCDFLDQIWIFAPLWYTVFENSDKILTFVSLRVDVNFETFTDAFSLLKNSFNSCRFFLYCTIAELRRIFKGQKSICQGFSGNQLRWLKWEFLNGFQTLCSIFCGVCSIDIDL